MKRVLIATPSIHGKPDVWYVNSLIGAVRAAQDAGYYLQPIFMSYDSLIQRARNDLFRIAVDDGFEAMIFIDDDMEFSPAWIVEMLERPEDVIGGTARKKTDAAEIYVGKTDDLTIHENGMIKCRALGTGFVKLSRAAFTALWDASPVYRNEGRECRMVANVGIVDGELLSEDTWIFSKLNVLGFDCWLAPHMCCGHVGIKKFEGDFLAYIDKLMPPERLVA